MTRRPPFPDYLWLSVGLSALMHVVLLFWPGKPALAPQATKEIDVGLVNFTTADSPLKPLLKAQANLDAGGEDTSLSSTSPLPRLDPGDPNDIVWRAMLARMQSLEQTQQRLLSNLLSSYTANPNQAQLQYTGQASEPGDDDAELLSPAPNGHIAQILDSIQQYQQRPRYHYSGVAAVAAKEARYLEQWRIKTEQTGTRHYPEQEGQKLYGSLQLSVYIQRDGSVLRTHIDRPAADPALNIAAQRIVQLAAPFAPVPADVAADSDVLVITRTWHFTRESLRTATSQ